MTSCIQYARAGEWRRLRSSRVPRQANAGHLPPYLNGQPLEIEGALPLGMIENPEFSMLQFRFIEGDHLLLMSDASSKPPISMETYLASSAFSIWSAIRLAPR